MADAAANNANADAQRPGQLREFWFYFRENRGAVIGLWIFAIFAFLAIFVFVVTRFFVSHFIFRWRTAMNDYYTARWEQVRHIEGASQRIQEDTMRFASIMEGLGVSIIPLCKGALPLPDGLRTAPFGQPQYAREVGALIAPDSAPASMIDTFIDALRLV